MLVTQSLTTGPKQVLSRKWATQITLPYFMDMTGKAFVGGDYWDIKCEDGGLRRA